jgi:purine operon repressor
MQGDEAVNNQRYKRVVWLAGYLATHASQHLSLTDLSRKIGVAKSTLSDDLLMVKMAMEEMRLGHVETQVGAQGGVLWQPQLDVERVQQSLDFWLRTLAEKDRRTPEGFLYMTDLLFDPRRATPMGQLLAEHFRNAEVDAVATVETKGIPLALATAERLGVGVVLLRRDSRLSDGSALSLNYLSGSSHRIQSMSLSRRTPVGGTRLIFVDDFMKAGGTARAAQDLLAEFDARVVGVGVLIATHEPKKKLVDDYVACLEWNEGVDGRSVLSVSNWVRSHVRGTSET